MKLKGKAVVVAGATGVLGGELARLLDEKGANLMLAGRDQTRLENTARQLRQTPALALFDIRSPGSAAMPIETATKHFGRLDGVINASGVVAFGSIDSYPEEVIDDLVSTNLLGPLHMMAAATASMDGGFFVNITGVVAEGAVLNMSPYVAAKTGLSAAGRALTRELRKRGFLVIDARPPHTETGLASRAIHGNAPRFGEGLAPSLVAEVIVEAIESDQAEVPSEQFTTAARARVPVDRAERLGR